MADVKITALNALTVAADDDVIPIVDITADETKKMTSPNFMKILNLLAALAAPANADVFAIYDDDAGSCKKITFANLQAAIEFPATTVMLFGQDAAPTGWTKKVDWTDISMLIYTTGAIANGGADDPKDWDTAITVDNHAALAINNHTALAINNHLALAVADHVLTQPTAHVITQPTFTGPSHVHSIPGVGIDTGSDTIEIDEDELSTSGTITAADYNFTSSSSSGSHAQLQTGSEGTGACTRTQDVALSNNHVGTDTDAHSFTQDINAHTFSQNIDAHTFSQNIDAHVVNQDTFSPKYQYVIAATKD